jgi:hypothetical protein
MKRKAVLGIFALHLALLDLEDLDETLVSEPTMNMSAKFNYRV